MAYIKRFMDRQLMRAVDACSAVLVTGPRQVGKSTMIAQNLPGRNYVTLDDPFVEEQAKTDSRMFMQLNPPPVTIDEIQHAPVLFRFIKQAIDKNRSHKGLFCMSGSQPYQLMQGVSESLSGRVRILELNGLSLREIQGDSFDARFLPTDEYVVARSRTAKEPQSIWHIIHRGGYPELQDQSLDWNAYYADYVKTYLERDVRSLKAVHDLTAFRQFMVAVASRTAQVVNYSNIADEIGKDVGTVKSWISILETSGIIYLLQPYAASELKRATRSPKIHFRDTGLVAYLTRWLSPETLACGAMAGAVFETFVVSEILKSFSNAGLEYRNFVSYYRGHDKISVKGEGGVEQRECEIDLVIEENGTLYPVEVKKDSSPKANAAAAFTVLDRVKGKVRGPGAIVCNCAAPMHLRDNLMALPVWYL